MSNHLYDGVFAPHADSTKTFLYTADRDISFAEFTALTDRIAAMLVAQGLALGDRVAVQADKSVLLFALYAATVKAGGVYLPLNTGYTPAELDYFLGDAKPRIVVTSNAAAKAITPIAARIGAVLMLSLIHISEPTRIGRPCRHSLHLRHHRPVQGRQAVPPEPALERRGAA